MVAFHMQVDVSVWSFFLRQCLSFEEDLHLFDLNGFR